VWLQSTVWEDWEPEVCGGHDWLQPAGADAQVRIHCWWCSSVVLCRVYCQLGSRLGLRDVVTMMCYSLQGQMHRCGCIAGGARLTCCVVSIASWEAGLGCAMW
jgi:hypothetical protein